MDMTHNKHISAHSTKPEGNRRRSVCVSFRMTPTEKAVLDRNAKRAGLSRTEYLVQQSLDKGIYIFGTPEQMERLIWEVNKIGVNLNQIAKRSNQGYGYGAGQELEKVHKDFSKLTDLVMLMTGK